MLVERLREIATEVTSDKRRILLRELTDMFFEEPDSRSETERALFGDIAQTISREMPLEDRSAFADRISIEGTAPHSLVVSLANDEIAVARPVLERSTVLTDGDICAIVEKRGEDHRVAVTARPELSAKVSEALVRHGGELVHSRLAEHKNAAISPASRKMLEAAQDARRASEMANANSTAALVAGQVVRRIKSGLSSVDREIVTMCDREMLHSIAYLLSALTQSSSEICLRTVQGGRPEALLMLMRAAETSFETFCEVINMRARKTRSAVPDLAGLRDQFDAADLASAQRVIRFLNLRQAMEKGAA